MGRDSLLLQPIKVGHLTLKNRIMFPPQTTGYEERDGSIGEHSLNLRPSTSFRFIFPLCKIFHPKRFIIKSSPSSIGMNILTSDCTYLIILQKGIFIGFWYWGTFSNKSTRLILYALTSSIFSNSLKIGNKTPAQLAEAGYNPDIIFKAQQSINGNYGGSYAKDGSETEIKKENIPTKEEYITQKLDSIRNNALERSRKKTQDETTAVTEKDVYGKKYVIDEAQDYGMGQLKLISKIFKNASYTILGDVNQTINPYYKYDSLEDLTKIFDDSKYIELTKTYRSSEEIIEFMK